MPIDERWRSLLTRMHTNARPGAVRTDFSFEVLRKAYTFIEEPTREPTMFRQVGHDENLENFEDNVRVAALTCYFISNTNGDMEGTGVAACYSGTAISKKIECFVQPPVRLTGQDLLAFLDMCESSGEFLHRAKFYYNDREYQTPVMLTAVRFDALDNRLLSVDSDFETRDTRDGDHVYSIKSKDTVLGSSRPEDIVNGPNLSGAFGDLWLDLYLIAKLAWRLDMLGLEVEYSLKGSCRVISVFYHFLPVYVYFAIRSKWTAFVENGFDLTAKVNGSEVSIRSEGQRGETLQVRNRVMSMGFSAVLEMWCSWLSNETTRSNQRTPRSKLHKELVALGDVKDFMKDFCTRTMYDNIQACWSVLLATVYPTVEYYKERVQLYGDLLNDEKLKKYIRDVYEVDVDRHINDIKDLAPDENTQYEHFAGMTQGLALFNQSIAGEKCIPRKGWSPQPLCGTRKMVREGVVLTRVTVKNGQLSSSRGLGIFSNAIKCIKGITILGNGMQMEYQERHANTSNYAIVNGLLSGHFGPKAALWMLNLLSEGLIKVNRTSSNCIGQCATDFGNDGVKIAAPLPPKVANELAYITDGTRILTMVNAAGNAVEVSTVSNGKYRWVAVEGINNKLSIMH